MGLVIVRFGLVLGDVFGWLRVGGLGCFYSW